MSLLSAMGADYNLVILRRARAVRAMLKKTIGERGILQVPEQSARVRARYDVLAPYVTFIDHLLMMSLFRVRARAIASLPLRTGDTAVELGCGTGRNFRYLRRAVGPAGRIIGVEFAPGMLARARKLVDQYRLDVELIDQDALLYPIPATNAVLLSLCYHTLSHPAQTLARIWDALKPGACLAIMDAKPPDFAAKLFWPLGAKILQGVFMGDPQLAPWQDLRHLGPNMQVRKFVFGSYYICWAIKP